LGPFCRARLQPEVEASALVADLSANLMRDLKVAPGQRITIALPPESLRIFVGEKA
jgi:hypothetical protein